MLPHSDIAAGGLRPAQPETGSEERLARAAWSRIAEPADPAAGLVVESYGAAGALTWLRSAARAPGKLDYRTRQRVERWAPRLPALSPERDLYVLERLGGTLLIPGDPAWPASLADLGHTAPHCLWVRGRLPAARAATADGGEAADRARAVAVVGSRASTRYGESVAGEFAFQLAERGVSVISGGAYGIDAAAHRGALAARDGAPTVAVLAGGVDRLYPAGNAALLEEIVRVGALLAEMPPGASPGRHRFLARNRIIAALGAATIVVEASSRSGALSTANHATDLLRPLGAVPGPVTSAASVGCHQLLRDAQATCVTGVEDILELAGPLGTVAGEDAPAGPPNLLDGLDPLASRVLDALPARAGAEVENVARVSGLAPREVLAALGTLQLAGRVRRSAGKWARVQATNQRTP